jgi:hypothetical protein
VSEPQSADLRVSDAERESAMTALGEHMSAGRLNIDEYGERSAQVTAAKTRGELSALFGDLPAPHPVLGGGPQPAPAPVAAPVPQPMPPMPQRWGPSPVKQRVMAAAMPLAIAISCLIFFATPFGNSDNGWVAFLLIPAVAMFGGVIFGNDWNEHRAREARHKRERERHELMREREHDRRELQRDRQEWHRELREERRERQREYRDRRRGSGY